MQLITMMHSSSLLSMCPMIFGSRIPMLRSRRRRWCGSIRFQSGNSDAPTLFDFGNSLELRGEAIAAAIEPLAEVAASGDEAGEGSKVEGNTDGIAAELVRLLEGTPRKSSPAPFCPDGRLAQPHKPRRHLYLAVGMLCALLGGCAISRQADQPVC
jgi:hypothetical protein